MQIEELTPEKPVVPKANFFDFKKFLAKSQFNQSKKDREIVVKKPVVKKVEESDSDDFMTRIQNGIRQQ